MVGIFKGADPLTPSLPGLSEVYVGATKVWPTFVPEGQQEWRSLGNYQWTCPADVHSVCVVCISGGGDGTGPSYRGGGGGGLGWKNDIPVVPGQIYDLQVAGTNWTDPGISRDSFFIDRSTVAGIRDGRSEISGGIWVGDGGGNGGVGKVGGADVYIRGGGGGGTGGYSGNGGDAGTLDRNGTNGQGGGGGGGGGARTGLTFNTAGGYGGGTEIYGEGSNGFGGSPFADSNGTQGSGDPALASTVFGGGSLNGNVPVPYGAAGAVRIIWGADRAFPSTNTGDVGVTARLSQPRRATRATKVIRGLKGLLAVLERIAISS